MGHIKKLEEYLTNEDTGYLTQNISKGKVLMLSGVWGSGKTHFWQKHIIEKLEDNIFISLYGKTSIKDIENEVLVKAYYRSIGRDNEEKDIIEKFSSTFSMVSKSIDAILGTKINEIKNDVNQINNNQKNDKAKEFITNGLIICFDDFERKSTNINLQDLFGFITNLALQYEARITIILNSDVFSGEDKKVFANVKEKSVSKYLSFSPTSNELFDIIFEKYEQLNSHRDTLKETFENVNIVNARIFTQVLDNTLEWIELDKPVDEKTLRLLVLVNINFILNHQIYETEVKEEDTSKPSYDLMNGGMNSHNPKYSNRIYYKVKYTEQIPKNIEEHLNTDIYDENIIDTIKFNIAIKEKENATKSGKADNSQALFNYIDNSILHIKSLHFMQCFKINQYCDSMDIKEYYADKTDEIRIFNKINDFIETGMI